MSIVLSDTYTGANGTNLTAHMLDVGGAYTVSAGAFDIQSNRAHIVSQDNPLIEAIAVAEAGTPNGMLAVTFNFGGVSAGAGILIARAQDSSHYLLLVALHNAASPVDNTLRLISNAGGAYTTLDTQSVDLTDNSIDYILRMTLNGTAVSGTIDGAHTVSATTSTYLTATQHGIGGKVGATFDGFTLDTGVVLGLTAGPMTLSGITAGAQTLAGITAGAQTVQ